MDGLSQTEKIIRRLYQVTSDYQKGFDIQVLQLIMLGLEQYNLDIGIFSKITNKKYEVVHCIAPEDVALKDGDLFDYESTYCELTCRSHKPVAVKQAGISKEFANHPAYNVFKLEAYIGVPIYLNDELYGTLNFSSASIRENEFSSIDVDLIYLMASWIESELLRHKQEQELKLLNEKLVRQANYDTLTQIPNRRFLFETLYSQIGKMFNDDGKGSIVLIDLDYFKIINDTYGHQRGDEVLKQVAERLEACIGETDFIARFGGEEFVVWLPASSLEYRIDIINKLVLSVNDIVFDGKVLTLSAGVCHFSCQDMVSMETKIVVNALLSCADKALYEAKFLGRDQAVTCSDSFLKDTFCEGTNGVRIAS